MVRAVISSSSGPLPATGTEPEAGGEFAAPALNLPLPYLLLKYPAKCSPSLGLLVGWRSLIEQINQGLRRWHNGLTTFNDVFGGD